MSIALHLWIEQPFLPSDLSLEEPLTHSGPAVACGSCHNLIALGVWCQFGIIAETKTHAQSPQ